MNKGMNESASYAVIKLLGEIADAVGESLFFKGVGKQVGQPARVEIMRQGAGGASCGCHVLGGAPCLASLSGLCSVLGHRESPPATSYL